MARPLKTLSTAEAAARCGLSERRFRDVAAAHEVVPLHFDGRQARWWKRAIDELHTQLRREEKDSPRRTEKCS